MYIQGRQTEGLEISKTMVESAYSYKEKQSKGLEISKTMIEKLQRP